MAEDTAPPSQLLIIEDDADTAELLRQRLVRAGHEVAVAHDGASGLATMREVAPDLILLDLQMAPVDGFEFLRRLADEPEGLAGTPVLVLSIVDAAKEVTALGARDFLLKPFDPSRLVARVADLLG